LGTTLVILIEESGFDFHHGKENFLFSITVKPGSGAASPWVKRVAYIHPVRRSRMVEIYLHVPYVFMAWCLRVSDAGKQSERNADPEPEYYVTTT
jgi:hypothetical protein